MANAFFQIYLHYVFAVSAREHLIKAAFQEELYKYISGIVGHEGQKLISIGGMPDHIHILVGVGKTMEFPN